MKKILLLICWFAASALASNAQDTLRLSSSQCRELALEQSYDIKMRMNDVKSAEHQKKEALSNFFPVIKGSAMTGYTPDVEIFNTGEGEGNMSLDIGMKGMYLAGIQLTQPIFAGGRIANGYKIAGMAQDVAEIREKQTRTEVVADVLRAYWGYVAVLGKIEMLEEAIANLEATESQVEASVEAEMATDSDLLRIRTALENTMYSLNKVRTGCEMCRIALSDKLGIDYGSIFVLPEDEDLSVEVYDRDDIDVSARPEMELMKKNIEISAARRKLTVGDYLPTLGLMAGYNTFGNLNVNLNANQVSSLLGMIPLPMTLDGTYTYKIQRNTPLVMLSLSIPITDWGKGAHAIRRARLSEDNAGLELEKNSRLLKIQAINAINNLDNARELLLSSERAEESAVEEMRIVSARYEVGMCTITDFLSAQAGWQRALSNKIEAQTQLKVSEVEYLLSVGKLE